MDVTGDGVIALEDLRRTYNVRSDPKYLSGEDTADTVLHKIITKFEKNGSVDGKVSPKILMRNVAKLFNFQEKFASSLLFVAGDERRVL